jgi:rhomboid protease GluP
MDQPRTGASSDPDDLDAARAAQGPLPATTARRLLDRGRERLDAGEPLQALGDFQRVIGHPDAGLTAEAWLGVGDGLYRLDAEDRALAAWQTVTKLPESPATYAAWRQIAGARVRSGDLFGAKDAYQEADRRAPAEDKAEIASRLGWLSKELGQGRRAGWYFARSRGTGSPIGLSQILLGVTVLVSLAAILTPDTTIFDALALEHGPVARGELWRLLSVTLLHANFLHLFFNMYALYLVGPIVESAWGSRGFLLFYLLTAAAASTTSFVLNPGVAVGASGAIFGLIGVLLVGTRAHHPVLDRRARAIVPQLGMITIINLAFGFIVGGSIDNAAHVGGLVAGLWLGLVVPPGRAKTLQSSWTLPGGNQPRVSPLLIAAGVMLLVAVVALGLAIGGVRF